MPKIKVNDINIYYETYGAGEPIVFVAELASDNSSWLKMLFNAYSAVIRKKSVKKHQSLILS